MKNKWIQALLFLLSLISGFAVPSCSMNPPAAWAQGGAPIALQFAHWERATSVVEIRPNGHVTINDYPLYILDRQGRVHNSQGDAYAVLETTNRLMGPNNWHLGTVAMYSASLPWRESVRLFPSGRVLRTDKNDVLFEDGVWTGCVGPMARTCTLVTFLIVLEERMQHENHELSDNANNPTQP